MEVISDKIYEKLNSQRKLLIKGKVDDSLVEYITMQIMLWNEEDDEIEKDPTCRFNRKEDSEVIMIYVSSIGGDGDTMFGIISAIESSRTPVVTFLIDKAYSAGFLIYMCGHVRLAHNYGILMYHQTSYGRGGEHQAHVDLRDFDDIYQQKIEELVLKYTKIPKKKLDEIRKSKIDWYMFADEALKYKIVDLIIPTAPPKGIVATAVSAPTPSKEPSPKKKK